MVASSSNTIKYTSNVQKVILKIKRKSYNFDNIQDRRIFNVLKDLYLKRINAKIHPKMRLHDVEELRDLYHNDDSNQIE